MLQKRIDFLVFGCFYNLRLRNEKKPKYKSRLIWVDLRLFENSTKTKARIAAETNLMFVCFKIDVSRRKQKQKILNVTNWHFFFVLAPMLLSCAKKIIKLAGSHVSFVSIYYTFLRLLDPMEFTCIKCWRFPRNRRRRKSRRPITRWPWSTTRTRIRTIRPRAKRSETLTTPTEFWKIPNSGKFTTSWERSDSNSSRNAAWRRTSSSIPSGSG